MSSLSSTPRVHAPARDRAYRTKLIVSLDLEVRTLS
ncbi:hypothetical protein LINPERHAP1_LOCUS14276 [Linum perenne]